MADIINALEEITKKYNKESSANAINDAKKNIIV